MRNTEKGMSCSLVRTVCLVVGHRARRLQTKLFDKFYDCFIFP